MALQVNCKHCDKPFHNPKLLTCLHSHCYECTITLRHADEDTESSAITCPSCNERNVLPKGGVDFLPTNLRIVEKDQQRKQRKRTGPTPLCDSCEQGTAGAVLAVAFCRICKDHLCQSCYKSHQRVKSTRFHSSYILEEGPAAEASPTAMSSSSSKESKCFIHSLALKYYCSQCHLLICSECGMSIHLNHSVREVNSELVTESKKRLRVCGKELAVKRETVKTVICSIEDRARQIQPRKEEVESIIKGAFMELYTAMHNREEELLGECRDIANAKESSLNKQQLSVQGLFNSIDQCYSLSVSAITEYTDMQLLSVAKSVTDRAAELKKQLATTNTDLCETADIAIEADTELITSLVEEFGCVFDGSPCSANSTVVIPRTTLGQDTEMSVLVIPRDIRGNEFEEGGSIVRAGLMYCDGAHRSDCEIFDNGDCTYSVVIKATRIGKHELFITINNGHVQGSPFVIEVVQRREYKKAKQKVSITIPRYITIADDGLLFVTSGNGVKILNNEGTELITIDNNVNRDLHIEHPLGIALDGDIMYLTENNKNQITKLTTDGEFLGVFGVEGTEEGQFNEPHAIGVGPDSKIYICDNGNRIQVFNCDWSLSHVITSNESIEFKGPVGLAFDLTGNVHIACRASNSVVVFSPDGDFIREYDQEHLSGPNAVAIDASGYSIVANYDSKSIAIFDPAGSFVQAIKCQDNPLGVAVSPQDGSVWVISNGVHDGKLLKY